MLDKSKLLRVKGILSAKKGTLVPKFGGGNSLSTLASVLNDDLSFEYYQSLHGTLYDELSWKSLGEGAKQMAIYILQNTPQNSMYAGLDYDTNNDLTEETEVYIRDGKFYQNGKEISEKAGIEQISKLIKDLPAGDKETAGSWWYWGKPEKLSKPLSEKQFNKRQKAYRTLYGEYRFKDYGDYVKLFGAYASNPAAARAYEIANPGKWYSGETEPEVTTPSTVTTEPSEGTVAKVPVANPEIEPVPDQSKTDNKPVGLQIEWGTDSTGAAANNDLYVKDLTRINIPKVDADNLRVILYETRDENGKPVQKTAYESATNPYRYFSDPQLTTSLSDEEFNRFALALPSHNIKGYRRGSQAPDYKPSWDSEYAKDTRSQLLQTKGIHAPRTTGFTEGTTFVAVNSADQTETPLYELDGLLYTDEARTIPYTNDGKSYVYYSLDNKTHKDLDNVRRVSYWTTVPEDTSDGTYAPNGNPNGEIPLQGFRQVYTSTDTPGKFYSDINLTKEINDVGNGYKNAFYYSWNGDKLDNPYLTKLTELQQNAKTMQDRAKTLSDKAAKHSGRLSLQKKAADAQLAGLEAEFELKAFENPDFKIEGDDAKRLAEFQKASDTAAEGIQIRNASVKLVGNIVGSAIDLADKAFVSSHDYGSDDWSTSGVGRLAYDAVSSSLMGFSPIGTIVGGAMKAFGFANDVIGEMTGPTLDFAADLDAIALVGSSYGGTVSDVNAAVAKSGKSYGLLGLGKKKKANDAIKDARREQLAMSDIAKDSYDSQSASSIMSEFNDFSYQYQMNGGYDLHYMRAAKDGAKIQYFQEPFKVILSDPPIVFKQGGTILDHLDTNFNFKVILSDPPLSFKSGGNIKDRKIDVIETNTTQKSVIPEGALHKNKHHLDLVGVDDSELTKKGIPVVDNDGDLQAEIELNEIIFTLEVTQEIEKRYKEFYEEGTSKSKLDELAIEAGKLLWKEILYNTDDRTGLIGTLKLGGVLKASSGIKSPTSLETSFKSDLISAGQINELTYEDSLQRLTESYDYLKNKGLSDEAVAGLLGNAYYEGKGFANPSIKSKSGVYNGWWQIHGSYIPQITNLYGGFSHENQMDYVADYYNNASDLSQGMYKSTIGYRPKQYRNGPISATSPEEAAGAWELAFERRGKSPDPRRLKMARIIYNYFNEKNNLTADIVSNISFEMPEELSYDPIQFKHGGNITQDNVDLMVRLALINLLTK